jgi:serine/threonine-protein phosphatase PGAM5
MLRSNMNKLSSSLFLLFISSETDHIMYYEAADAKKQYPELYNKWREDPSNFHVNGIYPLKVLWVTARQAWEEILLTPV